MQSESVRNFIPQDKLSQYDIQIQALKTELARARATGGKTSLSEYLNGTILGRKAAMAAKCCECMGYYADGLHDCEVYSCPLYPYMPYRANKKLYVRRERRKECPQCGADWDKEHNRCSAQCDASEKE